MDAFGDKNDDPDAGKYVSARSYKTFGTSNLTKARKKAVDNQLKSKGVKSRNEIL